MRTPLKNVALVVSIAFALSACAAAAQNHAGSAIEVNRSAARRLFEDAENHEDWALFAELHTKGAVVHTGSGDLGLDEEVQNEKELQKASRDISFAVDRVVAEGDVAVVRYVVRATMTGPLWGLPATGKSVVLLGVTIFRMADGKIAEKWSHDDLLSMLKQAGLIRPWCALQTE